MLFNDSEHRLLLCALSRERKICKDLDIEYGDNELTQTCVAIEKKVSDIQHKYIWHKYPDRKPNNGDLVIGYVKMGSKEGYGFFTYKDGIGFEDGVESPEFYNKIITWWMYPYLPEIKEV